MAIIMDLVETVKNSGVVGAGGAGFPTHVKLSANAEYIILNAAECEPLLRVDQQLIMLYTDDIIRGLETIVGATGAKKAFIAIKGKHRDAVDRLREKLSGDTLVDIFILRDFYPAGDEQVLVHEVTGRVVPEAGIPIKVGCIVINVETVLNIVRALSGKPVTHTYLTVTGKVPKPVTLRLPVGVRVREALAIAGVTEFDGISVIDGGPMMGKIISNLDAPITKTTKGLVVLDTESYLIRKKGMTAKMALHQSKAGCLQCRFCTDLCPRHLLGHNLQPHLMMRKSNYDRGYDCTGAEMAALCSECAVCELYACPAGLSPRLIHINYKQKLSAQGFRYQTDKTEFIARETGEYRKIPVQRLIARLGLSGYDVKAPLDETEYQPDSVSIPLKQHAGAPAVPVVQVGQTVSAGELIADIPANALGAKIHASIAGRVTGVETAVTIEKA